MHQSIWIACALAVAPLSAPAHGSISFKADVEAGGQCKAIWDGARLSVSSFSLQVDTPLTIASVPGAVIHADGSTSFYGASLSVSGWGAAGPADVNPIQPGITVLSQPLVLGAFEFWSTGSAADQRLLLRGQSMGAALVSVQGDTAASLQSMTVHIDRGAIYDALWAELIGSGAVVVSTPSESGLAPGIWWSGPSSWSIVGIDAPGGLDIGTGGVIAPFAGDMNGLLTPLHVWSLELVLPEPGTIGILAIAAAVLMVRRRHE